MNTIGYLIGSICGAFIAFVSVTGRGFMHRSIGSRLNTAITLLRFIAITVILILGVLLFIAGGILHS